MRPLYFLFPHFNMNVGGNIAQNKFVEICKNFRDAEAVIYGERADGLRHLDDILASEHGKNPIFVIHWGPDIQSLVERLAGRDVVYFAHSTGWGMEMPSNIPILCVSRNSQAYWGRYAPNSVIFYIPNVISGEFAYSAAGGERDIDVLVQKRKTSQYVMGPLVEALRGRCNLVVLDGWVDDLSSYFKRSKVYLYDSVEHWISVGATEGFGLPPLEAMGCGCTVFSSINDALSDYLDPGVNCQKIRAYSTQYDIERILRAVATYEAPQYDRELFGHFSEAAIGDRLRSAFDEIDGFFEHARLHAPDIADPWKQNEARSLSGRLKGKARRFLRAKLGTRL